MITELVGAAVSARTDDLPALRIALRPGEMIMQRRDRPDIEGGFH